MEMNKNKLWTKEYLFALILVVCVVLPMTYCMPLLPIYIGSNGGDVAMAGLVVSVFNLVSMICRPISAFVIDHRKKRPILFFALGLIVVSCFFYRFTVAIGVLLFLRGIHAIGYSSGSNAAGVVVTGILPEEQKKAGLGYYGFAISGAIALGPATSLLIMQGVGVDWAFTVCAGIACLGLLVLGFLRFEDKRPAQKGKFTLSACYEKSAIPLTLVMCVTFFAYSGLATFLSVYTISLGLGNINVAFYLVLAAGMVFSKAGSEALFRNQDTKALLFISILVMAAGLGVLSVANSIALFLLTALLFGLGFGTLQAGLLTRILLHCSPHRRGAANSTFLSSGDVGMSLGPVIWGAIAGRFGYSVIYLCGAVCLILNLVLLAVVLRGKESSHVRE